MKIDPVLIVCDLLRGGIDLTTMEQPYKQHVASALRTIGGLCLRELALADELDVSRDIIGQLLPTVIRVPGRKEKSKRGK